MKRCSFCAEEIQAAAIVCRFCNRELAPARPTAATAVVAETSPKPRSGRLLAVGMLIAVFTLAAFAIQTSPPSASAHRELARLSTPTTSKSTPDAPALALLSSLGRESPSGNYYTVEGQVKNLSTEPLKSVAAIATWYTSNGTFITSDEALIDFNPILPGQTSPFSTITRGNPEMSKFTVEFKFLLGGAIPTRDDRKQTRGQP